MVIIVNAPHDLCDLDHFGNNSFSEQCAFDLNQSVAPAAAGRRVHITHSITCDRDDRIF